MGIFDVLILIYRREYVCDVSFHRLVHIWWTHVLHVTSSYFPIPFLAFPAQPLPPPHQTKPDQVLELRDYIDKEPTICSSDRST